MTQQAREDLTVFLNELETLLEQVDRNPEWFPDDLEAALRNARQDLGTVFTEARAQVNDPTFATDSKLRDAGLSGDQLELKLTGFRGVRQRLRGFRAKVVFRRALRWANVILGSLAGVVGAAEPIKEFKESVEGAMDDKDAADASPPGGDDAGAI